jgi:hypothetical protein
MAPPPQNAPESHVCRIETGADPGTNEAAFRRFLFSSWEFMDAVIAVLTTAVGLVAIVGLVQYRTYRDRYDSHMRVSRQLKKVIEQS